MAFAMSLKLPAAPIARLATMTQPPRTTTRHARMQLLVSIAMATVWLIQTNDQICDQDEVTGCQDDTACNYDCNSHGCGLLRLCRNELRLRRQLLERLRSRRHLQRSLKLPAAPIARLATMTQPPRTTTLHARMRLPVTIAKATAW